MSSRPPGRVRDQLLQQVLCTKRQLNKGDRKIAASWLLVFCPLEAMTRHSKVLFDVYIFV
jgi:hypothetical protein